MRFAEWDNVKGQWQPRQCGRPKLGGSHTRANQQSILQPGEVQLLRKEKETTQTEKMSVKEEQEEMQDADCHAGVAPHGQSA